MIECVEVSTTGFGCCIFWCSARDKGEFDKNLKVTSSQALPEPLRNPRLVGVSLVVQHTISGPRQGGGVETGCTRAAFGGSEDTSTWRSMGIRFWRAQEPYVEAWTVGTGSRTTYVGTVGT